MCIFVCLFQMYLIKVGSVGVLWDLSPSQAPNFSPAEAIYLQQRDLSTGACWNPGRVMIGYTTQWDQSSMAVWDARFISHSNMQHGLGIVVGGWHYCPLSN